MKSVMIKTQLQKRNERLQKKRKYGRRRYLHR